MPPEALARQHIDHKLEQAGWIIQDMCALNLGAGLGVAVREYPTDTGPADYVLFVNREAVGVIEAKKDSVGATLIVAESQTARYANATLKWRKDNSPLRFLFEATGQRIDPALLERVRKRIGELTVNVQVAVALERASNGGESLR